MPPFDSLYGVGDQMARYDVNESVPRTLVRFLIRWAAEGNQLGPQAADVLRSVLDTAISPRADPPRSHRRSARARQ